MTLTLRTNSDPRATTKGSTLSHSELDNNFIHVLDTGVIVVGDDSTGATVKLGDTLKIVGGTNVTTAVSGNTVTVTASGGDIINDTTPQLGGNLDVNAKKIVSASGGNIELDPDTTGDVIFTVNTITATLDGASNGDFSVVSTGTGGMLFANNESETAYPTGAFQLKNTQNNAEVYMGQYLTADIQYYSIYFDPNENKYTKRVGSFNGDQNSFFGYNWTDNYAILQGNGGDYFEIDTYGDGSNSYAQGYIKLAGSHTRIEGNDNHLQIKDRTGDPSTPSGAANIYAKSGEMYVQDSSGNVTLISPHNAEGEWEYYSVNSNTGKTVKVNMEKMIRRLEEITGESFFEQFTPGHS